MGYATLREPGQSSQALGMAALQISSHALDAAPLARLHLQLAGVPCNSGILKCPLRAGLKLVLQ